MCQCRCGCLCRIISGFINFRRLLIGVHATILKTQQHIGCNTTFNIQIIPNGSSFHINNQNLGFSEMIRRSAAYLHHLCINGHSNDAIYFANFVYLFSLNWRGIYYMGHELIFARHGYLRYTCNTITCYAL